MNQQNTFHYIAIDVSKDTLHARDNGRQFAIDNDKKGLRTLLKHLGKFDNPLVAFEATGGYERPLMTCLRDKTIPYARINPARVRAFACSEGIKAKTDPIDSEMILRFAESKAVQPSRIPSGESVNLAALLDRRSHLSEQIAREKNRLQNSEPAIHKHIERMISFVDEEIRTIDAEIEKLVESTPFLKSRSQIMRSVKGVGKVTAWTMLAQFDEILLLNRNQLVALAGIAPFNNDSGAFSGKRRIQGGRAKLRKCLYMAAHTAARCNPVIKPYVQRLRDRGKPYKCAIVAAMRKLLIHIQSLIRKSELSPC